MSVGIDTDYLRAELENAIRLDSTRDIYHDARADQVIRELLDEIDRLRRFIEGDKNG